MLVVGIMRGPFDGLAQPPVGAVTTRTVIKSLRLFDD